MILVDNIEDVKGKFIHEDVEVLEKPYFNEQLGKWCALANFCGSLAIIELRVTPQPKN